MPKVKISEEKEIYDRVVHNIKILAAQKCETNSVLQISKRVGIPCSTLNYKMNNPDKFTLRDLYKIAKGLNTDIEKLIN